MRIWREKSKGTVPYIYLKDAESLRRAPTLIANEMVFVDVASFTFRFVSLRQLNDYLAYYGKKIHPSSRLGGPGLSVDVWETLRWNETLPMYLLEEPKRQKVVKALTKAKQLWKSGKL